MAAQLPEDISLFLSLQDDLLNMEREAEVAESTQLLANNNVKELQKQGVCLLKLSILNQCTGLYGKTLLTFTSSVPQKKEVSLPAHSITTGDIVGIYMNTVECKTPLASGVVTKIRQNQVTVAVEDDIEAVDDKLYRLMLIANDVTHRRLKSTVKKVGSISPSDPCFPLIDLLFESGDLGTSLQILQDTPFQFFNQYLDDSQREGVLFAMQQRKLAVIHGPPGTGKSTTVIEIIRQAVENYRLKLLVCAPSNVAVDNLLERLVSTKLKVVRLGHPARALAAAQNYSLDAILMRQDSSSIIKNVRDDINKSVRGFNKCKSKSEVISLRNEVKNLRRELIEREHKAIKEVLKNADVILSTTTSASMEGPLKHLPRGHFDMVIIDEASQALEMSCWIPMLHSKRCILAGDHLQLPPTILSEEASKRGLAVTLMERISTMPFSNQAVHMLTTQYRMNKLIMNWSSDALYRGMLKAHPSVADHLLSNLPHIKEAPETQIPLLFIDTAGCLMHEMVTEDEVSKGNEGEVNLVSNHIKSLLDLGTKMGEIGVITPYNLQVDLLRKTIHPIYSEVEIKSVDGYQGREKEAIIISLVRSNQKGEVGFLSEDRRINVAVTRARRHLCIVGDSSTISRHPLLQSLYEYMQEFGEVRTPASNCGEQPATIDLADFSTLKISRNVNKSDKLKHDTLGRSRANSQLSDPYEKISKLGIRSKDASSGNSNKYKWKPAEHQIINDPISFEDDLGLLRLQEQIETFKESSAPQLALPASLNARQRRFVHESCEKIGLQHVSIGEGEKRYIVMAKAHAVIHSYDAYLSIVSYEKDKSKNSLLGKSNEQLKCTDVLNSCIVSEKKSSLQNLDLISSRFQPLFFVMSCENCGKEVPKDNMQLHSIGCKSVVASVGDTVHSASSAVTKRKKRTKTKSADAADDDFDTLVEQFRKSNNSCGSPKCKESVQMLGQVCRFCDVIFCLKHHMAEVHGCGHAAKVKARGDISKPNQGKPVHGLSAGKRSHLNEKLNKTLGMKEEQRKKRNKQKPN